jgi:glutaminyl-tRNA synthetase
VRAKIDMTHPNMIMRDPPIYRIKHVHHHNTGDKWCLYPMYDFAHCLEDAIEHVTHSVCTLEFENNREIYDWLIENVAVPSRPRQFEFARLKLDYTVMSKRKLKRLVEEGLVGSWDDPRMPTISGMRRRGFTPSSIRNFCDLIGVAKNNSIVDIGKLEYAIRDDLNTICPRAFGLVKPLPLEITNVDDSFAREFDAPLWPDGFDRTESRTLTLRKQVLIDASDFEEVAPKGWKRLSLGGVVRLRYASTVTCDEVIKSDTGQVIGLRGRLIDGDEGPQPSGILHWLSKEDAVPAEMRLYERLFKVAAPDSDADVDFITLLNPDSLSVSEGAVEPWVASQILESAESRAESGDPEFRCQLERIGYFCPDLRSTDERPVLNRIVTLKDSWAKAIGNGPDVDKLRADKERAKSEREAKAEAAKRTPAELAADRGPEVLVRFEKLIAAGVGPRIALPLSGSSEHVDYVYPLAVFTRASNDVAKLFLNLHAPAWNDGPAYPAAEFERFAVDVVDGKVSGSNAKKLHALMLESGIYTPDAIESAGDDEVEAAIDGVLIANADAVERFREGKTALLGFFIGKAMAATGGRADAGKVRGILMKKLKG